MIVQVMGQALLLLGLALSGLIVARLTGLDKTLSCLFTGFLAGLAVAPLGIDTGIRAGSVQDLVFYLLLPPLMFQAALPISIAMLRRWLVPITVFATLGMAVNVLVTAGLLYAGISHDGFPWIAALLTGAILSATDPVSVVHLLRAAKGPEDIATLVEGESIFNDAGAAVLFSIILGFALDGGAAQGGWQAFTSLTVHIAGGIVLGGAIGATAAGLALWLRSSTLANLILVLSAYASFYVAQELLHFSGIISVVVTAIAARLALRDFEHEFLRDTATTWQWLGETFIALIFTLMGLVIVPAMFIDQWLAIPIAIVAALAARAATVYTCSPLSSLLMPGQGIPRNWNPLLVWGGLRGAIAIALVLTVPVSLSYWYTVQSMVFGVVLFTLLVQGTTCGPLIRRLDAVD